MWSNVVVGRATTPPALAALERGQKTQAGTDYDVAASRPDLMDLVSVYRNAIALSSELIALVNEEVRQQFRQVI